MNTSDVITTYLAARRAQGVELRSGARSLRQFARETGDGPLHEVTPQAVATFLRGHGTLSATWTTKFTLLTGLYRFALTRGYVTASPLPQLKPKLAPPQTPYVYSPDELQRLLDATATVNSPFSRLQASGKVRRFGVSNFRPMQIELLQSALEQPLCANQVQFGLAHAGPVDASLQANTRFDGGIDRDGSVIDYCRMNGLRVQAWSPLQFGRFEGNFLGHPDFAELNHDLNNMAQVYGVSAGAIAIAWILRHPANMQVLLGSTDPRRLQSLATATGIELQREHWYALYRAAGNPLP